MKKKTIDNISLPGIDQNRMQQDAKKMTRREFMRAAGYAGIAAPLATFIYNDAAAQTPKTGGLLKLGVDGGATSDNFDPGLCTNNTCGVTLRQWSDTLTRVDADGGINGLLAESFEPANDDGSKWAFRLHKGATFHNGKTLTADDIVAMLNRHSNEDSKSGALGILRSVKNVAADGKYTVIVSLDVANADFPYLMADYHLVAQTADSKGNDSIGTGPYIMEEAEHGVRYLTRKNPNYFRNDVGYVEQIETLVINDATARITALTTGDVHMISRIDPKLVENLKRVSGVTIENVSGRGHYVFICHTNTAPFDNKDLRLALKYAIDRKDIVKRILHGYGGVGNDFPINAAYPLFPASIPQREYDVDKAKHHYKKSGHSGPIVLRVADAAFPGAVDAATLFQNHAKVAGIDLEVRREPNDGYWSDVWNSKPFCASYWGGRPVQDQMYTVAYKSDADWNDTKWKRPAFDSLLLKARATLDENKRRALYEEMAYLVRDDGGAIIPMFNDFIDATRGVSGYKPNPNAKFSDDYAPIEVWLNDA